MSKCSHIQPDSRINLHVEVHWNWNWIRNESLRHTRRVCRELKVFLEHACGGSSAIYDNWETDLVREEEILHNSNNAPTPTILWRAEKIWKTFALWELFSRRASFALRILVLRANHELLGVLRFYVCYFTKLYGIVEKEKDEEDREMSGKFFEISFEF